MPHLDAVSEVVKVSLSDLDGLPAPLADLCGFDPGVYRKGGKSNDWKLTLQQKKNDLPEKSTRAARRSPAARWLPGPTKCSNPPG